MRKIYFRSCPEITSESGKRRPYLASMLMALLFLLVAPGAFAQTVRVSGNVTDEYGHPMPGVSVLVQGTTQGITTGASGDYAINVARGAVLQFRMIGYIDQSFTIGEQLTINVVLKEDTEEIEEVVVVGYGTVRKRDLTGAIASVSGEKIAERSYPNVLSSLSGQLAGVQITQNSGAPGMAPSIRVRGASSITSGTNPLYVIDGVPIEDMTSSNGTNSASDLQYNQNPLNNINPNDIESVEVLKDASSAAIYGSRGANGVVLITTKRGKAGKTSIQATYEYGISQVARTIDMMDAPQFIDYTIAARNNSWIALDPQKHKATDPNSVRQARISNTNYQIPEMFTDPVWLERIGQGTDWQDVLFRTAYTQNIQLSASGGNEKTQFMVSAGYLDSEGIVENTYYDRINLRANLQHKISNVFSTGVNVSLSRSTSQMFGNSGKSDAVSLGALQSDPIFPVINDVGTYSHRDPASDWYAFQKYQFQLWHPYIFTRESFNEKIDNNVIAVAYLDANIWKGLKFRTSISGTNDDQFYWDYRNKGQKYGHEQYRDAEGNETTRTLFNWVWENTLTYNGNFGNHAVTGLLGYSAQKQHVHDGRTTGTGYPNDLVRTLNAATKITGTSSSSEWALISYIARGTYSFKDKYLVTAAIRADGSSRFGSNNRWGYFPSASVGWRISEEPFMQGAAGWMDNLKLRVSYGETGNNQISNYASIGTMGNASYVFDNKLTPGMYTNSFPDRNLKWEKTAQTNIGLDASFFNQRIALSYDYYMSKTTDMLLNVPIPVLTGFQSTLTNIGAVENKGMELQLTTRNLVRGFKWNTDFNISGNRNKITQLGPGNASIIQGDNSCNIIMEVGKPIGNYYGYILDGVIMSSAELGQYPVWPGSVAGDPRARDVDGSGTITTDDRTVIGNYQPDFTWGLTNTFMWKGFDLSIMLTGSQGGEIMNQEARFSKIGRVNRNCYGVVSNFWRSESQPGDGQIFRPLIDANSDYDYTLKKQVAGLQYECSSYWVEDGSFIRIKNIRLGYTLPYKWTEKIKLASAKIYLNIENVYLFSDYINYDPEASSFQTGIYKGFDYGAYPNPRVWTLGVNFNF